MRRDGGGTPGDGGGIVFRDGGGVVRRDGGGTVVSDGGGRDLVTACTDACGHVEDCMSMAALDCFHGCVDLRRTLGDPVCEDLAFRALACIEGLDCYWLLGDRIGYSPCAGALNALEDMCLAGPPPPPPPMP